MDLPNLLNKIKATDQEPKNFLAIEINANAIKTAVWRVVGTQTELVSVGSIQTWETDEEEDLINTIDLSLSEALAGVEPEPNQVIFGLPEIWVSDDAIAENKKPLLKTICQKLGLKPVGFVVTTEAITHYLQDVEGGPPSAILINIAPDEIIVSLIYLGKIQGTQVVGRSQDLSADVEEGIARFPKSDNLPSRMILYDSREDLESAKQDLISYDWKAKLPFLHFPKIESLEKDATIKAVAVGGGAEVAKALGYNIDEVATVEPPESKPETELEPEPEIDETDQSLATKTIADAETVPVQEGTQQASEPTSTDDHPDMMEEFGFKPIEVAAAATATGAVAPKPPPTPPVDGSEKAVKTTLTKADIENIKSVEDVQVESPEPEPEADYERESKPEPLDAKKTGITLLSAAGLKGKLAGLTDRFKRSPKVRRPGKSKIPPLWIIGTIIFALILIGGFIYYWFFPTADVTIYVRPQTLEKEITFTLDADAAELDSNTNTIPGQTETISVSADKSSPTTGSLTVGERATGTVAVYNRTLSEKTFSQGTTIKYNDLTYTFDSEVSIASASSQENDDFSITMQPSQSEVNVTANDIGDVYNLPANTKFSVANFSQDSYIANANTAFSGGSAREIQAVSESDVAQLKSDLLDDLNQQVVDEVKAKSNGQQGVIEANEPEIVTEEYSSEIGDEADSLSLTMAIGQQVYTFDMDDITLITQQVVRDDIPDNFNVDPDATKVVVVETQVNEDGTATIAASISLMLIPKIDIDQVKNNIKGKYPPVTQEYFKSLPSYLRAESTITPGLPARLNTFPRQLDNITIVIETATQ